MDILNNVRDNNAPYINKILNKPIMTRTRLRNKFNKNPTTYKEVRFKKQCNFCVNLLHRERIKYYANLDLNKLIVRGYYAVPHASVQNFVGGFSLHK